MADNRNNDINQEEVTVYTLEFDDGETMECEEMGIFEYDGKDYIALIPLDGTDDVYIYGYEEDENGETEILDIVNPDLFEKVAMEFDEIMASDPE